ncbi:adenosylcobinamide-GDP ribazoletransferase [Teichococcus aerofrigidensis]
MLAAGLAGLGMTALARRQIGGQTGDVLGATAVVAECAVLSALAAG